MKKKSNETAFSKRLKELRQSKHYTQENISEKLNMDSKSYGKYERGETLPPIDRLKDICEVLNVSADYLVFGKTANADEEITEILADCPIEKQKYAIDCLKVFVLSHVKN